MNFGNKKIPNAPETKEALLLEEILERIGSNPYNVEINDPKIEIDPESEGNSVLFSLSINFARINTNSGITIEKPIILILISKLKNRNKKISENGKTNHAKIELRDT